MQRERPAMNAFAQGIEPFTRAGIPERGPGWIEPIPAGGEKPVLGARVLRTVMFTDLVGSTELVAQLGDARWRELLRRHDALLREEVARHGGRVVKSLGDGALVLFEGPSRAIACAVAMSERLRELGLRMRAGLHTGECELLAGADVSGIAVHIAARIAALAQADEVLASGTVRDLSFGSAFMLESRGEQRLKGLGEPWRIYAVAGG
jgi:class 3 adenylate cyclase